jgi:uncharacterized protein
MVVSVSYPGVYVQEVPSGVRTINAVGTSTAMFLGRTKSGVLDNPTRCFSYTEFASQFSDDNSVSDMARYVKLFFQNGGSDCYVMRIANGATLAEVTLQGEDGVTSVLTLTAKQVGVVGEDIRVAVTYNTRHPENTFNIQIFRWKTSSTGAKTQSDFEEWRNLSMNPNSSLYAVSFLSQESKLVNASLPAGAHTATNGYSQSGRAVTYDSTVANSQKTEWQALVGTSAAASTDIFEVSVDSNAYVSVNLSTIDVSAMGDATVGSELATAIKAAIDAELPTGVTVTVSMETGPAIAVGSDLAPHDSSDILRITSDNGGDVFIRPSASNDLAVALMLGTEQGGLELGSYAAFRPAPTVIGIRLTNGTTYTSLASRTVGSVVSISLDEQQADKSFATTAIALSLDTATVPNASNPLFLDNITGSKTGNSDGLREKMALIRDAVNTYQASHTSTFFWKAELWGSRLVVVPTAGNDNNVGSFAMGTPDFVSAATALENVRYYSVGINGTAGTQIPAASLTTDGNAPVGTDYDNAYTIIDREVDLFNLMVLPPDKEPAVSIDTLWGAASIFCQSRRALLLMDAPASWDSAQTATNNIAGLRIGLVKDHSAIFFPRLVINENGLQVNVGASGAMAGLMARIDGSRGVWKAAAGTEADVRGIVGIERAFSDSENGILNPQGINTIRSFPNGIVSWGARTMDGADDFASEWKYLPVRRLALMMEESLYRGLKWAVFEPNDEPLWAQLRLNVGAFMHNLFRQGAFQGAKPRDAYFVKCDSETTTQNDINLGIVNIWVGFAPLKPAEFVVLYLQQITGQVEV